MGCTVTTHQECLGLRKFFSRVLRGHLEQGGYFWDPACREGLGHPGVAEQSREGTPNATLGGWGQGMGGVVQ